MPAKSAPHIRTWGTRFDTLTSPPLSPLARDAGGSPPRFRDSCSPTPEPFLKPSEEKMPHDASVFVGSLPSTVEHQELTRLLSEHLSEHTEVKNIKVVRDSKGGVCAFVQCEDAPSAAALIHALHSNPPKLFLGRHLRYEPARAFRTLLVSYRTPIQYVQVNPGDSQTHVAYPSHKMNQPIELDLPFAMRIWKPSNNKFHQIIYNADAVNTETHAPEEHATATENHILFLQPIMFDSDTIHKLATYFGRLEGIGPYHPPDMTDGHATTQIRNANQVHKFYPAPHDSSRSKCMDPGCWEIKWEHRDDCVSALMTLRRVPHLTVTWAHQPSGHFLDHRSQYQAGHFQHNAACYPLHVQGRTPHSRNRPQPPSTSTGFSSPVPRTCSSLSENVDSSESIDVNVNERVNADAKVSNCQGQISSAADGEPSVGEFPPLIVSNDAEGLRESGVLHDKEAANPSTLAHLYEETESSLPSTPDISDSECQELEVPPTPGFGRSPLTPMTPGSLLPATPTGEDKNDQKFAPREFDKEDYSGNLIRPERELDPTTLFVGGLETLGPGAWDEEKLVKFFGRFGGLESVKVVRPQNSHAAFAFIKFDNTQSPARAVLEEHNRVYEGRAMRVQLRDVNPPRGYWKHHRGRGRFQSSSGNAGRSPDNPEKAYEETQPTRSQEQTHSSGSCDMQKSPCLVEEALTGSEPPAYSEQNLSSSQAEPDDAQTHPSTPNPALAPLSGSQPENYREWYDEPLSATLTPQPSSLGSSASVLPYAMPAGYYGPPPWAHPYAPHLPYPVPYMGYPGYRPPGQQLSQTFPRASEMTAPTAPAPWVPIGVYGSYIPYQASANRTSSLEVSQTQSLNSRAPLAPTGFIQNEQGTLIAVYQPEALDQYMAGSTVGTAAMPQHSVASIPNWPQVSQSSSYHYPTPSVPSRSAIAPTQGMTWMPNQCYVTQQPLNSSAIPMPAVQLPAVSGSVVGYRGGYQDNGMHSLQLRRQGARRESYSNGRNNHRSFANRNLRSNISSPAAYHSHNDSHSGPRVANLHQYPGEWNQYR